MAKYPRTFHLPFSPEVHSDDKVLNDISNFIGREIIVTEKLDGGNTMMNINGVYARSHSEIASCESFDYIKNVHFYTKRNLFKEDFEYFGENLYAIHSIKYTNLKDYFYLFSIADEENFLSFEDVVREAKRLDFQVVPVVAKKKFSSEAELKAFLDEEIQKESFLGGEREGFVLRNPLSFKKYEFQENVVKYVRKGHVQTDKHWSKNWEKNYLNE